MSQNQTRWGCCLFFSDLNATELRCVGVITFWTKQWSNGKVDLYLSTLSYSPSAVVIIFNIGDWLWGPENIKEANKDRCQDLCWKKVHDRAQSLFCAHTLRMNYVANTFLLVSSSVRSKQVLCFMLGQGQKREQKHTKKNFDEFHNHSLLLIM